MSLENEENATVQSEVKAVSQNDAQPELSEFEQIRKMKEESENFLKEANELAKRTAAELVVGNRDKYPFIIANGRENSVYEKSREWGISFSEAAKRIEAEFRKYDTEKYQQLQQHLKSSEPIVQNKGSETPYLPGDTNKRDSKEYRAPAQVSNANSIQSSLEAGEFGRSYSLGETAFKTSATNKVSDQISGYRKSVPQNRYNSGKASYRAANVSHLDYKELMDAIFSSNKS